jgi:hypothetical protein
LQLLSLDAAEKPPSLARGAYEGNRVFAADGRLRGFPKARQSDLSWLEASGWSAFVFAKRGFPR